MSQYSSWPRGAKVVVRCKLPDGMYSDTLGHLVDQTETHMRIATRRKGIQEVAKNTIAIGKLIEMPASPDSGEV